MHSSSSAAAIPALGSFKSKPPIPPNSPHTRDLVPKNLAQAAAATTDSPQNSPRAYAPLEVPSATAFVVLRQSMKPLTVTIPSSASSSPISSPTSASRSTTPQLSRYASGSPRNIQLDEETAVKVTATLEKLAAQITSETATELEVETAQNFLYNYLTMDHPPIQKLAWEQWQKVLLANPVRALKLLADMSESSVPTICSNAFQGVKICLLVNKEHTDDAHTCEVKDFIMAGGMEMWIQLFGVNSKLVSHNAVHVLKEIYRKGSEELKDYLHENVQAFQNKLIELALQCKPGQVPADLQLSINALGSLDVFMENRGCSATSTPVA